MDFSFFKKLFNRHARDDSGNAGAPTDRQRFDTAMAAGMQLPFLYNRQSVLITDGVNVEILEHVQKNSDDFFVSHKMSASDLVEVVETFIQSNLRDLNAIRSIVHDPAAIDAEESRREHDWQRVWDRNEIHAVIEQRLRLETAIGIIENAIHTRVADPLHRHFRKLLAQEQKLANAFNSLTDNDTHNICINALSEIDFNGGTQAAQQKLSAKDRRRDIALSTAEMHLTHPSLRN